MRSRLSATGWLVLLGLAFLACAVAGVAWLLADGVRYVAEMAK